MNETAEVSARSNDNPYIFTDMSRASSLSHPVIQNQFEKPFQFQVDGVLFYHKEAHYSPGYTPLVGWLKAYMLPEVLSIPMPKWIVDTAPSDYVDAKQTIEHSNKNEIERKNRLSLAKTEVADEQHKNQNSNNYSQSQSFEQWFKQWFYFICLLFF